MMDERRLREVIREELAAAADRQKLFLRGLGIDVDNPREQIADQIHLRRWRKVVDSSGMRAIGAVVVLIVTGAAGTLWVSFVNLLNRH